MKQKVELIQASKVECTNDWSWDSDSNQWDGFHLWYVVQGHVSITTESQRYELDVNDVFLFNLKENHICRHDPQNPLTVYTIYFHKQGVGVEEIKHKCLVNARLIGEMIRYIVEIYENKEERDFEPWLNSIFTEFISEHKVEEKKHSVIQVIQDLMKSHNSKLFSLEEMCEITGYSKNQLIRIMKKETGKTPIKYQMHYKMEYAKSLLMYSNETIESISMQVGFQDANYFSKVFKQFVGLNPKAFRKMEHNVGRSLLESDAK